jgi:hypothetical protein
MDEVLVFVQELLKCTLLPTEKIWIESLYHHVYNNLQFENHQFSILECCKNLITNLLRVAEKDNTQPSNGLNLLIEWKFVSVQFLQQQRVLCRSQIHSSFWYVLYLSLCLSFMVFSHQTTDIEMILLRCVTKGEERRAPTLTFRYEM